MLTCERTPEVVSSTFMFAQVGMAKCNHRGFIWIPVVVTLNYIAQILKIYILDVCIDDLAVQG